MAFRPLLLLLCATLTSAAEVRLADLLKPEVAPVAHAYAPGLSLQVFIPQGQGDGPWPLVILIHGGGWGGSSPEILYPNCRYLASRGLVAVAPSYRLTRAKGIGVGDCLADCRSAVRWTVAHAAELHADPHQVVLLGESAGGQLAAGVALIPDATEMPPIAALCLVNPVVDIGALSWWASIPGMKVPGLKSTDPTHPAHLLSPIFSIRPGLPPTQILHGEKDVSVPIAQVENFTRLMREAGNRCDLVRLPATGHAFLLPGHGTPASITRSLREIDRFLAGLDLIIGEPTLVEEEP